MELKDVIGFVQIFIAIILIIGGVYSIFLVNDIVDSTIDNIPEEHQDIFSKIPIINIIVVIVVVILSILVILQGISNLRKSRVS
tara:strand:- start:447 stop:698 length:252 start_codon:yes stop_codon:yes gene_type:complete